MADAEPLPCSTRMCNLCKYHWRGWFTLIVPIVFIPILFLEPVMEFRCCYLVLLMAFFWITEAIPLPITSLLPIPLLPLMGIMGSKEICLSYFTDSLWVFFGGLVVAEAIEYSKLHTRVGLNIILLVGCSPRKLHASFLYVTMFVSMWISNSASTAMMCPVIKAVLEELSAQGMAQLYDDTKDVAEFEPPYPSKTAICYYLGVAYAASFGGCGTLIGTGTNLTFKGIYDTRFPDAKDVDFVNFMVYNIPPMLIQTTLLILFMQWMYMGFLRPNSPEAQSINVGAEGIAITRKVIEDKRNELGPVTCHEVQVGILFLLMILLFLTRKPGIFTGYADIMNAVPIKNSTPLIFIVYLFFALPINYTFMKYFVCRRPEKEDTLKSLLVWSFVQKYMPWGLIFLLGGGFALASGIKASGFAVMVGHALKVLDSLPAPLVQFFCILVSIFCTNFTANVAICNILMPVLLEMAVAIRVHPLYLSLPSAMAMSMAFHFPVSTPPNAIAAGYGFVRTKDMAVAGTGPSLIALFSYFIASQTWAYLVFKNYDVFPQWAEPQSTTPK